MIDFNYFYRSATTIFAGSADGVMDGQLFAADGRTPLASVQYNFGALTATGIGIWGGTATAFDTIEKFQGSGACVDSDGDGTPEFIFLLPNVAGDAAQADASERLFELASTCLVRQFVPTAHTRAHS